MKCKLVCFDLDGTIIDETVFIWQTIHDHLKTDIKIREKAKNDFLNKKISYGEWALHDIGMWKQIGATKEGILASLKPLKLMEGARETLTALKNKGLKLAVISGSINLALEKVLPNYNDFFDYVFVNKMFFNKDGKIKEIIPTKYDFDHKLEGLKHILKKEKLSLQECVFVGDEFNDIKIASNAGLSIAFNSNSEELKQVSDVVVDKKDLREILRHIK